MSEHIYDALLVVSFGGPEGKDDVIPFLENVLRGRNVPKERMLEVAEHYYSFGGISPINEQNRQLIKAVEEDFKINGIELPIYFGNRNWHPLLPDTLSKMKEDGIKRALAFFTSAFSSYSGCRQYRENILDAQDLVGPGAPIIDKIRQYFNHPGFVETMQSRVEDALKKINAAHRSEVRLVYTAHSIPSSMAETCRYEAQLNEACRLISEAVDIKNWDLVYQSRSGPPTQPWLEPDVCDHLRALSDDGQKNVVVVPVGFISDHMEVLFDLDTEAREVADEHNMNMVRAGSAGTHSRFVRMIRELVLERIEDNGTRETIGELGPVHDFCPVDCCPPGVRPAPSTKSE